MLKRFPQIAKMDAPAELDAAVFFRITPTIVSILDYAKGFGHADTVVADDYDIAETLESMQHKWLMPVG